MATKWVDKIIDCAITNEERAASFYRYLAGESRRDHMKEVFLELAAEEDGHKAKLLGIKAGKVELMPEERVIDLKIADQLADEPLDLSGGMDYAQALVIAMKAEQEAYNLYRGLADATDDPTCKSILLGLAQEEAKHKLRFELEYDDYLSKDN